jgi:hypothetical protein
VHGNTLNSRGIVEICINSRWGRVCTDGWGDNDAAVVCKQLGYGSEGKCLPLYVVVVVVVVFNYNIIF